MVQPTKSKNSYPNIYLGPSIRLPLKDLGGGVGRRAAPRRQVASAAEKVGEAKVGDFDVHVGVQQQVFRLQVAVHDPAVVTVLDRQHNLPELVAGQRF